MGQQNQRLQKVGEDLNNGTNPVVKKWNFAKILQRKKERRRLPLEMECEIFKFLKLKMQQKLIHGMGRGIYGMFSQRILTKVSYMGANMKSLKNIK
jgi:CRISPR/Cas system CMR subunit Cmr6 (Cas7 group RAMP superfamily)